MAFVTTNLGEVQLLKYMLNVAPATDARVHLFTNSITPAVTDVLSQYTEATATGYASIGLTGSQWTVATVAGTSCATFARQTFSFGTSESLQGYYITDNANSVLIWADVFAGGPFNIPGPGGSVDVDPKICLKDC